MSDDAIFRGVNWIAVDLAEDLDPKLPYATHTGTLTLAGVDVRCYRLNDGRCTINATDVEVMLAITLGTA